MNAKQYTNIIMQVLQGLKSECEKVEDCYKYTCDLSKPDGTCLLRQCPCDYDLTAIENSVLKIIEKEMLEEELKNA